MHKTKKKAKFKSRRAAAIDKLGAGAQKKIKSLESRSATIRKKALEDRNKSDEELNKLSQEMNILENPHMKKAVEMAEFMTAKFKAAIKTILEDKRFKHLEENDFAFSFDPDKNGECVYINFEMDLFINEEKKVKFAKEEEDDEDDWSDDDDEEDNDDE